MTRAELERIRNAALAQAKEAEPTAADDDEAIMRLRAWLALAQAADNLDAHLARAEQTLPLDLDLAAPVDYDARAEAALEDEEGAG